MGQSYSDQNGSVRSAKAERAMQLSARRYYQRQREMKDGTGLNGSALSDVQTSVIFEENEPDPVDVGVYRRRLTDAVSPVVEEHDYYNIEMVLADKAVSANGSAHVLSSETRF